ncbi:MAG: efflux transporter outer membrane subunit [Anaeromyxobacter sp.]
MRSARTLAAAALLAAAGCSLAPRYQRPELPVATAWPVKDAAGAGAAAGELGWRDVFGDPRLQALVAMALENNRDLRVATLNVELARAQYRIQRAPLFPEASGQGGFTRAHAGEEASTTGRAYTANTWSASLGLSWELDLFGRVRSLSEAAVEEYLATDEARRSAQLALVAEVATQYLAVRAGDDQVALARQTLQAVQASQALVQRIYQGGQVSELDVRIAEAQVATARFNLSVAERTRNQAQEALVLLVGSPLPEGLPEPLPLDAQPLVAELPAGLPSEVLQRRPDVLSAEHQLRAANASIGAARAAFFPTVTLTGSAGSLSPELSGLFGAGTGTWSFAPRLTLPIFQGGALRAGLDVAQVRRSIQVASYERAIQVAFREVADALESRGALEEQLAAGQARVSAEERRFHLADLRYRKGVDSYLAVLTAQRDSL